MARRVRPWLAPAMAAALGTAGIAFVAMAPLSGTRLPLAAVLVMGAACLGLGLMWLRERARMRDLQQRMGQVEALLAAHPALTLILTPSGQPVAAYGAAPVALPVEDLFRDGLVEAVHAPDRPAVLAALKRAHRGSQVQVRFAPRLALDLRLSMTLRPLPSTSGEPMRLIAVLLDASLQHAREEELVAARTEAEAQSLSKSRALANVSHELRTPLNAVIGFSDIMAQGLFGPLPERYNGYAHAIHDAGRHLLDLIGDLLDVSRIEAERYELNLEDFDVREVIASAMALVRVAADEKGVDLAAVLPPQPVRIRADRRAIKQIALNLLSNGVKFTPAAGSVTIAATAVGHELELVVADTGLGIAPEDLARLGRPFEQAGGADQRAQGTGLGLSLVRALTELHQGRMSLDSTPGSGTAVTVRLPVLEKDETDAPSPLPQAEIIPLSQARRNPKAS